MGCAWKVLKKCHFGVLSYTATAAAAAATENERVRKIETAHCSKEKQRRIAPLRAAQWARTPVAFQACDWKHVCFLQTFRLHFSAVFERILTKQEVTSSSLLSKGTEYSFLQSTFLFFYLFRVISFSLFSKAIFTNFFTFSALFSRFGRQDSPNLFFLIGKYFWHVPLFLCAFRHLCSDCAIFAATLEASRTIFSFCPLSFLSPPLCSPSLQYEGEIRKSRGKSEERGR